jgi:hypothetical protein
MVKYETEELPVSAGYKANFDEALEWNQSH